MSLIDDAFDSDAFVLENLPFAAYYSIDDVVLTARRRSSDDPAAAIRERERNYGPSGYQERQRKRRKLVLEGLPTVVYYQYAGFLDRIPLLEPSEYVDAFSLSGTIELGAKLGGVEEFVEAFLSGNVQTKTTFAGHRSGDVDIYGNIEHKNTLASTEWILEQDLYGSLNVGLYFAGSLQAPEAVLVGDLRREAMLCGAITVDAMINAAKLTRLPGQRLSQEERQIIAILSGLDPLDVELLDL